MIQVGQFFIALVMLNFMLMWNSHILKKINDSYYYKITYSIYLLTRFLGVVLFFYIFNRPGPGDLMNHFYPEAISAGKGQLVYNDFPSRYSFLFPYLISPLVILVKDRIGVVLIFAVFDLLLLIISQKYITEIFGINKRHYLWIYTFCPLLFITTVYWAQDEIIVAFFITSAFILMKKQKEFAAILVMLLGFYCTKFISIYFYLPLFIFLNKKKYICIFIAGFAVSNLLLYAAGVNIFMPLREGAFPPEGTSFWHLFRRAGLPYNNILAYVILVLIISGLLLTRVRMKFIQSIFKKLKVKNNLDIVKYSVISALIFMAFSAKAYSYYFVIIIVFYFILFIKNSEIYSDKRKILFFYINRRTLELSLYLFILSIAPIGDNFLRELKEFNILTFFSYILILIVFTFHIRLIIDLLFTNTFSNADLREGGLSDQFIGPEIIEKTIEDKEKQSLRS